LADFVDLIEPVTEEEILQQELNLLELQGFPVSAWQAGSVPRVLLQSFANVMADAWQTVADVAKGSTLQTATGGWLDLLAASQYGETRQPAESTQGVVRLTDAGGGPHSVAIGQLYVATASGLRYRNTATGTIPLNGYLDLAFQAETAGSSHNVANGAIVELVTALSTVTASNPAAGTTGTWITSPGSDGESDVALRARCTAKWATLSTGSPVSAYIYWALLQTGVTRASVDDANPDGPGTARVYIDSSGAVSEAQTYIDARKPIGTSVTVIDATTVSIPVAGAVYVENEELADAQAQIALNLAALSLETAIGGRIYAAEIIERVMNAPGVLNYVPQGLADVVLTPSQIPQLDGGPLVFVSVL
jgi:uncharacterized phage protein gp47/JayE